MRMKVAEANVSSESHCDNNPASCRKEPRKNSSGAMCYAIDNTLVMDFNSSITDMSVVGNSGKQDVTTAAAV